MAMSPRPPAPTVPAIAEKPKRVMNVNAAPRISDGRLSNSSTLNTICRLLAPKLCAASTRLPSTSASDCSTTRATNGAAVTTSGTIAPGTPSEVPTMRRVSGIRATSRMMNGTERTMFTIQPSTVLSGAFGRMPFFAEVMSSTPTGRPITYARKVATAVMMSVSRTPSTSSSP